jgi:hypothetical protein
MRWASLARHRAVVSGGKFVLLLAFLLAPLPGLGSACSLAFCIASTSVLEMFVSDRNLVTRFEPLDPADTPPGFASGWTVQLRVLDLSATGPATKVPLDLRFPYFAFALFTALVVSAPIERRRKRNIFVVGSMVLALRLFLTVALPLSSFFGVLSAGSVVDGVARLVFRSLIEPPNMLYATPILLFLLGLLLTAGGAARVAPERAAAKAGPRSTRQ